MWAGEVSETAEPFRNWPSPNAQERFGGAPAGTVSVNRTSSGATPNVGVAARRNPWTPGRSPVPTAGGIMAVAATTVSRIAHAILAPPRCVLGSARTPSARTGSISGPSGQLGRIGRRVLADLTLDPGGQRLALATDLHPGGPRPRHQ